MVALPPSGTARIRHSARLAPGEYQRPAEDRPAILLEGLSDVVLDLEGVLLRGAPTGSALDLGQGTGILVRDCERVVLRGGELGGYRGCVVIEDSRDVTVEGVRFDGYFAQRLGSTPQQEDPADWLWPHDNDDGEWLRAYGAAISATRVERLTVRDCRARHGQNGLLLTRCSGARVFDNDLSFLSGWGLAMYRTSGCVVSRNRFDYCVRGYSHGEYWRGQDSAGILMFERCCDNVFAYNSATHGGDGVFLFGGRDLVDGRAVERGEDPATVGGGDRNLWYENDFSYAVANAIEATFSRDNVALRNRLNGSHQHGVWGGYSSRMVIAENEIVGTLGGAVSIEHGQDCLIARNVMRAGEKGVELWWDPDPDFVQGPFADLRETASRSHWVLENEFAGNVEDLVLLATEGVCLGDNRHVYPAGGRPEARIMGTTFVAWDGRYPPSLDSALERRPGDVLDDVPGVRRPYDPARPTPGGLETIVMGEWGPWDFESGEPRPEPRAFGGLLAGVTWNAVWFDWSGGPDPRDDPAGWRALAGDEHARRARREDARAFRRPWSDDEVREAVGNERFGLLASARLEVERAARYRLEVVSDDGVRVLVDGVAVIENWTWHAPARDVCELDLQTGAHRIELEYFQIDGAAALALELVKAGR